MWVQTAQIRERIAAYASGDDTALVHLYNCFATNDSALIYEAASTLADRMEGLSVNQCIRLLDQMGQSLSLEWYNEWREISPEKLRGLLDTRAYFAVLAVGTAHPNGYYRERCLRELATFGGTALPYLLLRANDWVTVVRTCALKLSQTLLESCPAAEVLAAMPYLYRLECCHRRSETDYASLQQTAEQRLVSEPALLAPESVRFLDRNARRLCYRLALREGLYPDAAWEALFRVEKDPFTRRLVAKAMLAGPRQETAIPMLLAHRDGTLRMLALQTVLDSRKADWDGYEPFLFDPRRAVRELARYAIRQQNPQRDFAQTYRESLAAEGSEGALAGLGETGAEPDAAQVRPYLTDERLRLRKAALTALGRLCKNAEQETYYQLLGDEKLSKIAFSLLLNGKMRVGCARLYRDLQQTQNPILRRRLCVLLAQGGAWDSLPGLLALWDDADEIVSGRARYALAGWQFGYERPMPGELERCRRTLDHQRPLLPPKLVQRLEFEFAHA